MTQCLTTRRSLLKTLGAGAAASMLPLSGPTKPSARKPNIVFILADDLGYGDLSCYGQQRFRTPNIDRLAAEGMRFTQHYSGSTVCAPSRCCLMTGLHTGHCQIRGNGPVEPEGQTPMRPGTLTIPRLLRTAGYVSGMFGKWGLGGPGSTSDPLEHFDEFCGYNCQRIAHDYYPEYLWHNAKKVMLDGNTYSHGLIMDAALRFITANRDRPFFCYLPVTIPHAAMSAPRELHEKYRRRYSQFEHIEKEYGETVVRNPIAAFPAMIERLDEDVGRLTNLLADLGIDDNTIVIFTSDNGPHSEGGHDPHFWNSSGPLRGRKRSLYEGGIRVPFIARWKGRISPASVSNHVSAFWDLLPTIGEAAHVATPEHIDGISLLPELLGKPQLEHDYLYWEFAKGGGRQAIRKGRYKA
ncbi:MAG: sulfatase-like hydrolase/transferase, partial [Chitinivibrionales bacterium]|nr:sulfatase-like hydrolase/transferase [Chitinivibrionales bacterium]